MDVTVTTPEPQNVNNPPPGRGDLDLTKLGNTLVTKFHVLMRVSQIYDSKNVTFRQFIQESLETLNALIGKEGSLSLKIVKDELFLNDQRLRYSVEGFTSFKYLLTQWKKRLIGGVIFKEVRDERSLKEFIFTMNTLTESKEDNAAQFNERMARRKKSGPGDSGQLKSLVPGGMATNCMLIRCHTKCWSASKLDKELTAKSKINSQIKGDKNWVRTYKTILDPDVLKVMGQKNGAIHAYVTENTMPWLDSGVRLLPAKRFLCA